ncbi:hypothetical protein BELL_0572g00080 [Botrytis elliptica]|uniref:Uncharacterized protein n=1 Tax=Botrytis elliptica TaxID=278938 RepID=A0A4Z1JDY9_9HELO|nr:hypothetical protein EAE99_005317 [Botrytis elliptica]TGO71464.1 hypothetical protein BELL_0572g00080 [Botrytis elliptica]
MSKAVEKRRQLKGRRRGPDGRLLPRSQPSPTKSIKMNSTIGEDMNDKQSEATLINAVIRYAGSVDASDAATANAHHQPKPPNILINQEANKSARPSSDQAQEAEAQNIHQCEILDTPDISKDLENSTSTTIQQIENTRTDASIEFDNADADEINKVIDESTANVENGETENEKLGAKNTKKRKPANDSASSTSNSKRTRSTSSEAAHRQQFETPFQIPITTTERMRDIESHKIKRNLKYMPNRTSAVLKPDGTQNNTSVEAHLVQERGEVFTSKCNSCGNKGRPAGPWEECVALEGFLQGSCANCHVNNLGKRCSLRPQKDHFFLAPSKNARIASKSTSKKRTGGSEEVLIEQLMAMDSDGRDDLEDKANDILTALRKTRLRLRKINKKKSEEKCDSTDEKEDGVEETQDLMIDPRLHES